MEVPILNFPKQVAWENQLQGRTTKYDWRLYPETCNEQPSDNVRVWRAICTKQGSC